MNVLPNNCKQNTTSLSLLAGRAVKFIRFLHGVSADSDQTWMMHRLICV